MERPHNKEFCFSYIEFETACRHLNRAESLRRWERLWYRLYRPPVENLAFVKKNAVSSMAAGGKVVSGTAADRLVYWCCEHERVSASLLLVSWKSMSQGQRWKGRWGDGYIVNLKNEKMWTPHLYLFQLSYIWILCSLYTGLDDPAKAGAVFIPSAFLPFQWVSPVLSSAFNGSLFIHAQIFFVSTYWVPENPFNHYDLEVFISPSSRSQLHQKNPYTTFTCR